MTARIELNDNKRYMTIDDGGNVKFYRKDNDKLVGKRHLRQLLDKLEMQAQIIDAYTIFQRNVETAAHKVNNDRLNVALEEIDAIRKDIKEAHQ